MNEQSPVRPPLDELFRDGGAIRLLHSGRTFAGVAEVKCLVNARFSPSGNTRFNVSGNACRAARVLTRGAVWTSRYPIPARVPTKRGGTRRNPDARSLRHFWFHDLYTGSVWIHCVIRRELIAVLAAMASRGNRGVSTPERRRGRTLAAAHLGYTARISEARSLGLVISTTRLDQFQSVSRLHTEIVLRPPPGGSVVIELGDLLLAADLLGQSEQQLRQTVTDRAAAAARNAALHVTKFRAAWGAR